MFYIVEKNENKKFIFFSKTKRFLFFFLLDVFSREK